MIPQSSAGPSRGSSRAGLRKGWKRLAGERRALLQLLGRCAISEDQALRFYDTTARAEVGIKASDADLLRNPFLLFEPLTAVPPTRLPLARLDRGLFPDEAVREQFPVLEPSRIEDPADDGGARTSRGPSGARGGRRAHAAPSELGHS